MSEQPATQTPKGSSVGSTLKESFKNIGRSIDTGLSSLVKEMGQNIRTNCPACHETVMAPPNEDVRCPLCSHEFRSETVSERTAEVSRALGKDMKETWESNKPKPSHEAGHEVPPRSTAGA